MFDKQIHGLIDQSSELFKELRISTENYNLAEIKKQLMLEISSWIEASKLKQIEAAEILAITRPRVSDLMTGKYSKFTIDALINILERTGQTVEIAVAKSVSLSENFVQKQ